MQPSCQSSVTTTLYNSVTKALLLFSGIKVIYSQWSHITFHVTVCKLTYCRWVSDRNISHVANESHCFQLTSFSLIDRRHIFYWNHRYYQLTVEFVEVEIVYNEEQLNYITKPKLKTTAKSQP